MEKSRKIKPMRILCIVLSLLLVSLLSACGAPTEDASAVPEWTAQETLKSVAAGDISDISYTLYTEGGALSHRTEAPAEIEEIYRRLCDVRMTAPTAMGAEDNGLRIEVRTGEQTLVFEFEGDILVLEPEQRFKVEQLGSLKSYLTELLDEAQPGKPLPDTEGMSIFSSEVMDFSFLYDSANTAYVTDAGAAQIAVGGDTSLVGLSVSAVEDTNLPEVSQIIEEAMFDEMQKYQNAIAQPPAENEIVMDGHTLLGYIFAYSDRQGKTVDCSYYVEARDGRCIYYRTEMYRDAENYWAGQDALETAVKTLALSGMAYGASEAVPGEIGTDNTPRQAEPPEEFTADTGS